MKKIKISTSRLLNTSQSWFQNSFWNHIWTIFLHKNQQNVRYKQTNQKMKISISATRFGTISHQLTSFASYTLWWSEGKTVAFSHLQNDVSDDLFLFCPLWGDMQEYQVSVFTFYLYSRFQGSAYILRLLLLLFRSNAEFSSSAVSSTLSNSSMLTMIS